MKKHIYIWLQTALVLSANATYINSTLNISSTGNFSEGSSYKNIGAIIPIGGHVSHVGTLHHQSGFASGFILCPETSFTSLPDELNPDNDLDGLIDNEELIAGSDPFNSDTDDDGLGDYMEVKTYGTNPSIEDTDNDGLDDGEEVNIYSTNPALPDSDNDGMSDPDELVAGTSPTNQNSVLSLNLELMLDGDLKISWFGVAERFYTFEYAGALTDNWQSYPIEVCGADAPVIFIDDPSTMTNHFYRVRVRHSP